MTALILLQIEELTAIIKSGGTITISSQDDKFQIVIGGEKGMAYGRDKEFYYAMEGALHALANRE